MNRRTCLAVVLATFFVTSAGAAFAQNPPPGGGPPPPRGGRAAQRNAVPPQGPVNMARLENQVQETWNLLVLKQSKVFLELSDQQYPNFFSKMTTLQELRDRHMRERHKLVNELRAMTNRQNPDQIQNPNRNQTPPTDAELTTKSHQLDDLETQFTQQEHAALQAVDEVLTPFQRARFRVFEEQMDVQKLRMIAQVMRNAPPAGAPQQPGGNAQQPAPAASIKPGRGGGR